jgi:hypothetical protein
MLNFEFADIKPAAYNWVIVTLMAVTGIVLLKYILTRWPVRGLSEVIQSV